MGMPMIQLLHIYLNKAEVCGGCWHGWQKAVERPQISAALDIAQAIGHDAVRSLHLKLCEQR